MNNKLKKGLRTIGHGLKAVVTVAGNGLSENVIAELNRALDDHELIKLKIFGDKSERAEIVDSLKDIPDTAIIQVVGGMALIYRASREPDPLLSNIARANVL
jgi:RNA-binding protein